VHELRKYLIYKENYGQYSVKIYQFCDYDNKVNLQNTQFGAKI